MSKDERSTDMIDRIVRLPREKDKYGVLRSDSELNVPDAVKDGSILFLMIERRLADPKLASGDTALRYLIGLIISLPLDSYLSVLLKAPSASRLSDFTNLRIELYKRVEAKELLKTHIQHILSALAKLDCTLACGMKIRDWGRFRANKEGSISRQITDKEVVWDEIKGTQSKSEAKEKTQAHLKKQYDGYEMAAQKVIDNYQSVCKVTQGIAKNYSMGLITRDEADGKTIYQIQKLGYQLEDIGQAKIYYDDDFRGTLPTRALLAVLIILKLYRPLNADTWLFLKAENVTYNRTSIEIADHVKGKTNTSLPSFRILNKDRLAFKAMMLLKRHYEATKDLIELNGIELRRPQLLFDYLNMRAAGGKLEIVANFQYLRGAGFDRFCKAHDLEKITLDTLRNLVATKLYFEGGSIHYLRKVLNHNDLKTTQKYVEQHITSSDLRHSILRFIRELEAEVILVSNTDDVYATTIHKDLEEKTKADNKYYLLPDGATCTNVRDSPDPKKNKGDICEGKHCHLGCKNRKIVLNNKSIWQALVKREEYRSSFYAHASHKEKFAAFDAHKIIFNALLCQYIADKKPEVYSEMMDEIHLVLGRKNA